METRTQCFNIGFTFLLLGLTACASRSVHSPLSIDREPSNTRVITTSLNQVVGANLSDFAKMSPKTLHVFVLPKVRTQAIKNSDNFAILGKPIHFSGVSVATNQKCGNFETHFKKMGAATFFRGEDAKGLCGVFEITNLDLKKQKNSGPRRSTLMDKPEQIRVFLNQKFGITGFQFVNNDRGRETLKGILNDPDSGGLGGLEIFPVDLPPQSIEDSDAKDIRNISSYSATHSGKSWGDRINTYYAGKIRRDMHATFQVPSCSGKVIRYKDYYGQTTTVGWCNGQTWPKFIETNRYLAVASEN